MFLVALKLPFVTIFGNALCFHLHSGAGQRKRRKRILLLSLTSFHHFHLCLITFKLVHLSVFPENRHISFWGLWKGSCLASLRKKTWGSNYYLYSLRDNPVISAPSLHHCLQFLSISGVLRVRQLASLLLPVYAKMYFVFLFLVLLVALGNFQMGKQKHLPFSLPWYIGSSKDLEVGLSYSK